jgi:putative glutamine amidotransferase
MRLKEEHVIFLCAMLSLPMMIFLLPLMLAARFGRPKRGVKIALTVSNRWPAYLQFIRLPYDLAILRAGAKVVTISPKDIDRVSDLLDVVDAVIISGGEDIAPGDELNNANSRNHNIERDALELAVLKEAGKRGTPTLCVCRGMQLLSLSRGGGIACHDADPELSATHKTTLKTLGGHSVGLKESSRLRRIFGQESIRVNSLHHQHITDSGTLVASGRSPDGLIEAVEQPGDHFVLGVQWHPELQAIFGFEEERLFKALVDAAVEWREKRSRENRGAE